MATKDGHYHYWDWQRTMCNSSCMTALFGIQDMLDFLLIIKILLVRKDCSLMTVILFSLRAANFGSDLVGKRYFCFKSDVDRSTILPSLIRLGFEPMTSR